ncbi:MAG: hypothetical protein LBP63_10040 [Prevotellaceae bacterium]|jgi:hypothetical protein|nr:hypothetical protein [Prevotellaceae bacterium]
MAIVNSLAVGKAKGSAGNINFYQRMGETIMREKVLHPANPRTKSQMTNRAKFMNAILFFAVLLKANAIALWDNTTTGTKKLTRYQNYLKQNLALIQPYIPRDLIELQKIIAAPFVISKAKGSIDITVNKTFVPATASVIFEINKLWSQLSENIRISFIILLNNGDLNQPILNGAVRIHINNAERTITTEYFGISENELTLTLSTSTSANITLNAVPNQNTDCQILGYEAIVTEKTSSGYDRKEAILELSDYGLEQYNYFTTGQGAKNAIDSYPSGQDADFYAPKVG